MELEPNLVAPSWGCREYSKGLRTLTCGILVFGIFVEHELSPFLTDCDLGVSKSRMQMLMKVLNPRSGSLRWVGLELWYRRQSYCQYMGIWHRYPYYPYVSGISVRPRRWSLPWTCCIAFLEGWSWRVPWPASRSISCQAYWMTVIKAGHLTFLWHRDDGGLLKVGENLSLV